MDAVGIVKIGAMSEVVGTRAGILGVELCEMELVRLEIEKSDGCLRSIRTTSCTILEPFSTKKRGTRPFRQYRKLMDLELDSHRNSASTPMGL